MGERIRGFVRVWLDWRRTPTSLFPTATTQNRPHPSHRRSLPKPSPHVLPVSIPSCVPGLRETLHLSQPLAQICPTDLVSDPHPLLPFRPPFRRPLRGLSSGHAPPHALQSLLTRTLPSRLSPLTAPRPLAIAAIKQHIVLPSRRIARARLAPGHALALPPLAHTAPASLSPHRAPLAHKSTSGPLKERSRRSSKPARTPSPSRRPAYVTSLPSPLARLSILLPPSPLHIDRLVRRPPLASPSQRKWKCDCKGHIQTGAGMEYLGFGTETRTGTGIVLAASICNTHVLCRKPHITKTFVEPEALKRSPRTEDDAPHIETARVCAGSKMGA